MDLQLEGKRAFVTGGSRGIGKAVARVLLQEGCDVAIGARDVARLDAARAELAQGAPGRQVLAINIDTASDASVAGAIGSICEQLGGIDILVNNAAKAGGQAPPPKLADIDDEVFWSDVNVKVMGYLRCAREVAPLMAANGWGRIVNISGLAARSTGSTVGSIRNVAVAALTKNLADELGPSGISASCVHPGLTRTEATPAVVAARAAASGIEPAEVERRMAAGNTIRKVVDAEEVAWVVAFLASPRSVAINGDAIVCGGGQPGSIHY